MLVEVAEAGLLPAAEGVIGDRYRNRHVDADHADIDFGREVARGVAARDFAAKVNVGMVGINVPIPVPIAYYTFGGWKKSGFGDLNQHGPDSIRFYTKTKTITSRWPSGVKEGAEFSIPTMN